MITEHEVTEIAMLFLREEEKEQNHKGSQEQIILTQNKNNIQKSEVANTVLTGEGKVSENQF